MSKNTNNSSYKRLTRTDQEYAHYNICSNYEVDNSFLFDLLERSKYNKFLKFVKINLEYFENYYFEHDAIQDILSAKLAKEINYASMELFIKDLQKKIGIDLRELIKFYKHENNEKVYREVSLTKLYNEVGKIDYNMKESDYIVTVFDPEAVCYIQNLSKPTIRFSRTSLPLIEINLDNDDNAILEYIQEVQKNHKSDKYKNRLLASAQEEYKAKKQFKRSYTKNQYYADLLYVYDRVKHGGKRIRDAVYENIANELTDLEKSTKSIFVKKEIKRYNALVKKMISDLEIYIDSRIETA